MLRHYTNTAIPQPLSEAIDSEDTVVKVDSTAGFPPTPFVISLERGTPREEACLVTDKDETTFTVTRGYDGTVARPHDVGSLAEHTVVAIDYRESTIATISETQRDSLAGEDLWEGRVIFNEDSARLEVAHPDGWDQILPTGAVIPFGGDEVPTGFLLANGQLVSREDYAGLFAVIGTTFGAGDGSTTFAVPDLRQRFPLGLAAAGTGSVLGAVGGSIDHTHTQPSHTHSGPSHTHSNPNTNNAGSHSHSLGNTGSGGSHSHSSGSLAAGLANSSNIVQGGSGSSVAHPAHSHNISGTTSSGGSHTHSTPNTNSGGSHNHSQGNTGSSGTGQTSASGDDETGPANPPYLVLNYLIRV